MNRGSLPSCAIGTLWTLGFNEAPIHESGKFRLPRRERTSAARRFNEAPIHESGKCRPRNP